MNISVQYSGSKITVSINKEPYFRGVIKKKFWKDVWVLFDDSKNEVASYTMDSRYFLYDFKMEVRIKGDSPHSELTLIYKNKKPHFSFDYSGNNYLVVLHSNNKISFFKGNRQFAYMEKKKLSGWSGQEFSVKANGDTNIAFFIVLLGAVLITGYSDPDSDSDFTIDLGNFAKELQPVDGSWQPTA